MKLSAKRCCQTLNALNAVVLFVLIFHGVGEALLSALGVAIVGMVYPKMYEGLLPLLTLREKYLIGTFSALNAALGIMLSYYVYMATFRGKYYELKRFGSLLCIADVLYSTINFVYATYLGWAFLIPGVLDVVVLIPKFILFVGGVADKYYEYTLVSDNSDDSDDTDIV